jgi:hypothetical protein
MAGDVRGHDLGSWWTNRARYREDASGGVHQWRAEAERLSRAAGGARATAVAGPPDETLDSLTRLGASVQAALADARSQLQALEGERQQAQYYFAAEQSAIESASAQRVRQEREAAHRDANASAVRAEKSKVLVRKSIAIVFALVVLYVIVRL